VLAQRPPLGPGSSEGEEGSVSGDRIPPRVPRAEAVGRGAIRTRMFDIEQEVDRLDADLAANQREYDELFERRHFLVSEHDRLRRKLVALDEVAA
jgi:hypothetical protein